MKVIKRDGRIEEFVIDKIRTSLARTSDEAKNPLTDGDLKVIEERIMRDLMALKKDKIESRQIRDVILEKLNYCGFSGIARKYESRK
ncbi:ATP cone domain-containing protein [Clostridium sp. BSD9I1]|uniref:ATP cone domain-containing protein n=1 Tax=Clostridium sp. BSD9I1 TaxID=2003589 RepID=UPI0016492792|nr:ATP cone domain-containing protein [Clostridium sp. BSD9I1]